MLAAFGVTVAYATAKVIAAVLEKNDELEFSGARMKKPVLSIDEPEPRKASRADRPPTEGFVVIVDGHFKTEFDTMADAEASGRKLKSTYPMLQIEIYDATKKTRTLFT